MKKFLFLLLLVSAVLVGTASLTAFPGDCDITNGDGACCNHLFDEEGPYGSRGVYFCTTDDPNGAYVGYGPSEEFIPRLE